MAVRNEIDKRLADVGDFIRTPKWRMACAASPKWPASAIRTCRRSAGMRKPSAEILQQIAKALQISMKRCMSGQLSGSDTQGRRFEQRSPPIRC